MADLHTTRRLSILLGHLRGADFLHDGSCALTSAPRSMACAVAAQSELQPVVPESVGFSSERLKRVDAFVQSIVKDGQAPMAVVGVVRHGQLAFWSMAGHSHEQQNVPVAEDTIYRMFSFTKPVTSVALLMLYEEGRFLSFDEPVAKYIPCFQDMQVYVSGSTLDDLQTRPAKSLITIKNLLTHTSGFGYAYLKDIPAVSKMLQQNIPSFGPTSPDPYDLEEACRRLAKVPLLCDPGTEWHYSVSTDVAGRLVEVLSGQSFGDFLQDRIFNPLGMVDTGFVVPAEKAHRLAGLYGARAPQTGQKSYVGVEDPEKSVWAQPRTKGLVSGGGGLVSTMPDWIRWIKFLLRKCTTESGEHLLGPKTFAYAALNHLPDGQCLDVVGAKATNHPNVVYKKGQGWSLLGLAVMQEPFKYDAVCSKGELAWGSIGSGYLWIDHEEDLAVIINTQVTPSAAYPWRRQLHGLVYQALMN